MFGFGRTSGKRLPVDAKARSLAGRREIACLSEESARTAAKSAGYLLGAADQPGIPIGQPVHRVGMFYGSLVQTHVDIWGPRRGKTTCRVIPALAEAIGPALLTSTKRDAMDATLEVRKAKGGRVFVFDPHGITEPATDDNPACYWDPLEWIDAGRAGDEARAAKLASHFACGADVVAPGSDPEFAATAEDLLAGLFLAAACDNRLLVGVVDWIASPRNPEPIELLRRHGKHWAATFVASQYQLDYRSQERLFGTALRMVGCLRNADIHPWIQPSDNRIPIDELDFLRTNSTLYALTTQERNSAAPLVSALADAIIDVAMREADRSAHGHLNVPLLAIFDDAEHTARRRDLPALYARLGPRGIMAMTMLQSWSQGVRCWGAHGMAELWSAADIRVVGSGLDDVEFVRQRIETARGEMNRFTISDLLCLPRERIVIVPSDGRPALARAVPWWSGEHATEIQKALADKETGPKRTQISDLFGPPSQVGTEDSDTPDIEEIRPL